MAFGKPKNIFSLTILLIFIAFIIITIPWFWRLFYPFPYRESILQHSREFRLDPNLVVAVVRVESKFRPNAESPRGAKGLMQLMPDTAQWAARQMGIEYVERDLFNPDYNLTVGCWYLSSLLHEFDNNVYLALAAYNGGRGNVQEWLRQTIWNGSREDLEQIPFQETRNFITRVMHDYRIYQTLYR